MNTPKPLTVPFNGKTAVFEFRRQRRGIIAEAKDIEICGVNLSTVEFSCGRFGDTVKASYFRNGIRLDFAIENEIDKTFSAAIAIYVWDFL